MAEVKKQVRMVMSYGLWL